MVNIDFVGFRGRHLLRAKKVTKSRIDNTMEKTQSMNRYLQITLTLIVTFALLTVQTIKAEDVVKERGFSNQKPSGQGFDKPLPKKLRVGATMPTFNASAQVAIMEGMKQAAKDYNID